MKANDLSELEVVDGQSRIVLKRGGGSQAVTPQVVAVPQIVAPDRAGPQPAGPAAAAAPEAAKSAQGDKDRQIVSPIVGTFFTGPSPSADPFVEVGSKVKEDSVVCIIEAMKVMNEIKSELAGTIKKVLVENEAAVEYGQALFLVEVD